MADESALADRWEHYKPGSIQRIKLHNFLTYQDDLKGPGTFTLEFVGRMTRAMK
jgi:hypothetical protein